MVWKVGVLVIFVVDVSGSMVFNRMNNVKGVVMQFLVDSYISRDQVLIIFFCGNEVEVFFFFF